MTEQELIKEQRKQIEELQKMILEGKKETAMPDMTANLNAIVQQGLSEIDNLKDKLGTMPTASVELKDSLNINGKKCAVSLMSNGMITFEFEDKQYARNYFNIARATWR